MESGEADDERQSETQRVSYFKSTEHPDILKPDNAEEIIIIDKVEPGTNFNNLSTSIVRPTREVNQFGIYKFHEAFKRLGVRINKLISKELQLIYEF